MKKIVTISLAVAALALPAVANAQTPAPATTPTTTGAPATGTSAAMSATTKVELSANKDGYTWAQVGADSVKVTKNGTDWVAAPDGTWTSKDGKTTITTKGGKEVKKM